MRTMIIVLLCSVMATAADPWAEHSFAASPDAVYAAAELAIAQHHEVQSKDPKLRIIRFHVGTTAWSWGYNMIFSVQPAANGGSSAAVEIERSGGKAVSWGSGKKEVGKVFAWTEQQLTAKK